MRQPLKIGDKVYKFKKDAMAYYREILNSYNFGESLSAAHYDDLIDLLDYDFANTIDDSEEDIEAQIDTDNIENEPDEESESELIIDDIKVSKVQFNTKCFELFYSDGTSDYISYLMLINNTPYNPEKLFSVACRNSIHNDIRSVKQDYFDKNSIKGEVKCQETGILSKWTELVVDHRQPNTFSIIVDRFKEVNKIILEEIEYTSNDKNHIIFKDENLAKDFQQYHKDKANLRIVRKERNASRASMGRLKKTSKDLTVKDTQQKSLF
jgi:hypothetical protein